MWLWRPHSERPRIADITVVCSALSVSLASLIKRIDGRLDLLTAHIGRAFGELLIELRPFLLTLHLLWSRIGKDAA